jgi:uncharacterized damage-inducible protein DinB
MNIMKVYESPTTDLIKQMLKGTGFTPYERMFGDLSTEQALKRISDAPYTIAEVLAHMNFWQSWTLQAIAGNPQSMIQSAVEGWPTANEENWSKLTKEFLAGLEQAIDMTNDATLLSRPIITGEPSKTWIDQHSVGSALTEVIAYHNAHHVGQIILLRRLIHAWPPEGGGMTW